MFRILVIALAFAASSQVVVESDRTPSLVDAVNLNRDNLVVLGGEKAGTVSLS